MCGLRYNSTLSDEKCQFFFASVVLILSSVFFSLLPVLALYVYNREICQSMTFSVICLHFYFVL